MTTELDLGKPMMTRDGLNMVKYLYTLSRNSSNLVFAFKPLGNGPEWASTRYADGRLCRGYDNGVDVVNVKPRVKGWLGIYKTLHNQYELCMYSYTSQFFPTKEAADAFNLRRKPVALIEVDQEEEG